jgi:hypothetical protein
MICENSGLVAGASFPATKNLKVCASMKKKIVQDAQSGSNASQEP